MSSKSGKMQSNQNGLLHLHYKARQQLRMLLSSGERPEDLGDSVWTCLLQGELTRMSGHTLACLIDGFGFMRIRNVLRSCDGFEATLFQAWRVVGGLTNTELMETGIVISSEY
jgi:hypothetical protein